MVFVLQIKMDRAVAQSPDSDSDTDGVTDDVNDDVKKESDRVNKESDAAATPGSYQGGSGFYAGPAQAKEVRRVCDHC